MSSTFRDTAEHTARTITDLMSDAIQHIEHIERPHLDVARLTHRRRTLSPAIMVAILLIALGALGTFGAMRTRRSAPVPSDVVAAPSAKSKKTNTSKKSNKRNHGNHPVAA